METKKLVNRLFEENDDYEENDNPYSDGYDGWDEEKLEDEFGIISWIEEVERLAYELRGARRGSYALNDDSVEDLVMYVRNLADTISDIADNMEMEIGNFDNKR